MSTSVGIQRQSSAKSLDYASVLAGSDSDEGTSLIQDILEEISPTSELPIQHAMHGEIPSLAVRRSFNIKTIETVKPRASLVRRTPSSEEGNTPQRIPTSSSRVSFHEEVALDTHTAEPHVEEGRTSLMQSLSKISSQNLLPVDAPVVTLTEVPPEVTDIDEEEAPFIESIEISSSKPASSYALKPVSVVVLKPALPVKPAARYAVVESSVSELPAAPHKESRSDSTWASGGKKMTTTPSPLVIEHRELIARPDETLYRMPAQVPSQPVQEKELHSATEAEPLPTTHSSRVKKGDEKAVVFGLPEVSSPPSIPSTPRNAGSAVHVPPIYSASPMKSISLQVEQTPSEEEEGEHVLYPKRTDSFRLTSPPKRPVPTELKKLTSSLSMHSRPPLPSKSISESILLSSVAIDRSIIVQPRDRSDFAFETNAMMEGWMDKMSATTGFWLRRYYVLSETVDGLFNLKIYGNAVEAAWGMVPLQLKYVVPVRSFDGIETVSAKVSKGREFIINIPAVGTGPTSPAAGGAATGGVEQVELRSVASEDTDDDHGVWAGRATKLHLRAIDPETRLLWVTLLLKAKSLSKTSEAR